MRCRRGQVSPDDKTKRELWASCGGYCQRPSCRTSLFVEVGARSRVAIGEMAHIIGASGVGPRAPLDEMADDEKGNFENLIMLCPTCHTIIDKEEASFPDDLVKKWKRDHARTIADALGAPQFTTRVSARTWLEERLLTNRTIHSEFGPDGQYRFDPESELAGVWKRKMVQQIIPLNHQIVAVLDANTALLRPKEREARERLRQHVDDLENFHIWGIESVRARFPSELDEVFRD